MSKSTAKRSNKQPGKAPKTAKASSGKLDAIRAQREQNAAATGKPTKKRPAAFPPPARKVPSAVKPDDVQSTPATSPPSVVAAAAGTNGAGNYETPTTENNRYGRAARAIGPVHMNAILVKRMSVRLDNMVRRMEPWKHEDNEGVFEAVRHHLKNASSSMRLGATQLESVPRDWRPRARVKGAAASKRVDVGTKVTVRDNVKASYDGLLDAEDLSGLTVAALVKGKAKVTTSKGGTLFFPRGHLIPEAATSTGAQA